MAKSSENSSTYRRAWVLNLRAWKLWAEKSPAYFVSSLLRRCSTGCSSGGLPMRKPGSTPA